MTIEQKIAEILAESRKAQVAEEVIDEVVAEEVIEEATEIDEPSEGKEQNKDNARNDVDKQEIGGKKSKDENEHTKNASAPEAMKSIKEDVAALVDGEELSEEFKEKAATIFEAAVLSRVKAEASRLEEAFQAQLNEELEIRIEEITEGLVEKVDGYLDYVVEQWMTDNEIALERGMKSEILEGFVSGLKGLFEEHYIDVPEERFDVLGALEEQVDELSGRLDEQFETNVFLNQQLNALQKEVVISDLAEGLVATDKEKFLALAEELSFEDVESFAKKAQTIRESYFTTKAAPRVVSTVVSDEPVSLAEETVYAAPQMKQYLSVLDNLK